MAVIGSLSVKLGLVTVEWDKATAKAKQDAKAMQMAFNDVTGSLGGLGRVFNSLGGALGVTSLGFAALATSAMSFSNEVKDLSDGFGISIQKTLQFRNAIEVSGGSADQANKILSKLFTTLSSAQEGNTKSIRLFEDLGVTFKEINTLSPEASINRVFKAISEGGDANAFKRIAAIKELLGRGGIGLSVKDISDLLQESTQKFDKHAAAIKRVGDANDSIKTSMDNLKIAMSDILAPFLNKDNVVAIDTFRYALIAIGSVGVISALASATKAVYALATAIGVLVATEGTLTLAMPAWLAWFGGVGAAVGTFAANVAASVAGMVALGAWMALHSKDLSANEDADWEKIKNDPRYKNMAGMKITKGEGAETPSPTADEAKVEDTPAVKAIKAKIALTEKLIALDSKSADVKANSVWTDEYTTKNKEVELALEKQLATIRNAHAQYLATDRHTADEIAADKRLQAVEEKAATQKALDAHRVISAQYSQELTIMRLQSQLKFDMAKFDEASLLLNHKKTMLTEYDYNVANEVLNSQKKILQLKEKIAELPRGADEQGRAHYEAERKAIQDEIDIEIQLSNTRMKLYKDDEDRRRSFSYGWEQAAFKYQQDLTNASAMGGQAFTAVMGDLNSALDNFVEKGKLSFSDLIGSMIKDLMKLYLKSQASGLFDMISSSVGSLFGGALPDNKTLDYYMSFNGKATGGSVNGGSPYIVGENGPELFIPPKGGGSIIPNMQMSQAMGSGQPQIVYNGPYIAKMDAIDTQSGIQFLAKNKDTIWAANQSAQRGLPTSR